uniref:Uncharacterized protein n=1 Tax=Trichuris muris TaxID=70415 RepID=A0A5S6QCB0_TRIMR
MIGLLPFPTVSGLLDKAAKLMTVSLRFNRKYKRFTYRYMMAQKGIDVTEGEQIPRLGSRSVRQNGRQAFELPSVMGFRFISPIEAFAPLVVRNCVSRFVRRRRLEGVAV